MSQSISSLPPDTIVAMIWDFHGPSSRQIAEHHKIHLKEFMTMEALDFRVLEVRQGATQMHSVFLSVNVGLVADLRARLKPHRGQIVKS